MTNSKVSAFLLWLKKHTDGTGAQYLAFGIFGFINYPISYFMWSGVIPQAYNSLSLRLVAAALCLPLIFYKAWPQKLEKFLPLYWYLSIMYCLPFFGSYMLLMNHASDAWLMNMVLGLFLFIMLVDWLMFIILLTVGVSLGWCCYAISSQLSYHISHSALYLAAYMYFFAIIIGSVFSRNKENIAEQKIETMTLLAANLAHELRTPLATIEGGMQGLQRYLPNLITGYQAAYQKNLEIPLVYPIEIDSLKQAISDIRLEVKAANSVIDMLLINVQQHEVDSQHFKPCSIHACIEEAIKRYPFTEEDQAKVQVKMSEDFQFWGSELLTIHILFNLFKNALYFLMAARKGEIEIWTSCNHKRNYLHFRDTGKGIDPTILPHIFDKFYTKTYHGHGVGLAFCKMVMRSFRGDIRCHSVLDEYAEFVLEFPKIKP